MCGDERQAFEDVRAGRITLASMKEKYQPITSTTFAGSGRIFFLTVNFHDRRCADPNVATAWGRISVAGGIHPGREGQLPPKQVLPALCLSGMVRSSTVLPMPNACIC